MLRKIVVLSLSFILSTNGWSQTANIHGSVPRTSSQKVEEERSYFDPKELVSNYVSWGINPKNPASINLLEAWKKFKKESDVVVAVVDTGIDASHPFLHNNIFVINGKTSDTNFGVDFSKNKKNKSMPIDQHGHGSHVSGIIKSIFPEVRILPLKYYDPSASGLDNLNSTVDALRYAVDNNVDIINYSGGGPEAASEEYKVLKEAEKKGILVVAAAGNDQSDIDDKKKAYFPASYGLKNIISVTAYDENLKILSSSNYGLSSVDIFAPGHRIYSSIQNGRAGYLTGTSQATAFVTGVAALIKSQYPYLSMEKIKEAIRSSAKKENTMIGRCSTGGRLDAAAALAAAAQYPSENKVRTKRQLANDQSQNSNREANVNKEGKIIYRLAN